MKNLKSISLLLIVALTAGCGLNKEDPVSLSAKGTQAELAEAKTAAAEASKEMRAFAYEQRAQFSEKMKAQVAALNESVDTLSAKVEKSTAAVKADAAPKLAALRAQIESLKAQIVALDSATPSTWERIKTESIKAYDAVSEGFDNARQWTSEVIAP